MYLFVKSDTLTSMKREFTASCYIFDDEKIILVFHKKFNKWMPPGGHLEPNETPQEAAIRESFEETGLEIELCSNTDEHFSSENAQELTRPYMCLLENIAEYKSTPFHQHIDFIFIGQPIGGALVCNKAESDEVRAFSESEVDAIDASLLFPEVRKTVKILFSQFETASSI